MKQLILITTLLFAIINSANALSIMPHDLTAKLTTFEINHDFLGEVTEGTVRINHGFNTITLELSNYVPCPEGMACIALAPIVERITLNMDSVETAACGETVYKASVDKRIADGMFEEITVIDYTTMLCEIVVPYPTAVTYKTINPWGFITTESYFNGAELKTDFPYTTL